METDFSRGLDDINSTIKKVEFGSDCYKLLCEVKYKFIKYYKS